MRKESLYSFIKMPMGLFYCDGRVLALLACTAFACSLLCPPTSAAIEVETATPLVLDALKGDFPAIVGGEPDTIVRNPWMISIRSALATDNLAGHRCGGALISPTWIITAAHCLEGVTSVGDLQVLIGTEMLTSGGEVIPIAKYHLHENYNSKGNDNDIALIKLSRSVNTKIIRPITMEEEASLVKPGVAVRISGWGLLHEDDMEIVSGLQSGVVQIIKNEDCANLGVGVGSITPNMICAGIPRRELRDSEANNQPIPKIVDACQGDSGGPLILEHKPNSYLLVGIVSWGIGCGRENKYGIYTRVGKYSAWIYSFITNN